MTSSDTLTEDKPVQVQTKDEYESVTSEYPTVLVDFYADWCGPCQMIAPTLDKIAADTDATVAKVDVDANQELAMEHGVQGVPTMKLYSDSEEVEELVGAYPENQLRELIERCE